MVPAKDISQWQGNWQDTGEPIVLIKMSGGDNGLYMDTHATSNYDAAVSAGKAVGGYHFIGWTMGATQEAAWFYKAMSPVAENDVFCLDIESIKIADPVGYVMQMVEYLEGKGITGGLGYMNLSTLNAYDWTPFLTKWGLWLADWNNDPAGTVQTKFPYVMQQYSDGPKYDHDEWFGTVDEFKKYGYHAPQPAPAQAPAPAPTPTPAPVTAPQEAQPSETTQPTAPHTPTEQTQTDQPTTEPTAPKDPTVVSNQPIPQTQTPTVQTPQVAPKVTFWVELLNLIRKYLTWLKK